MSPAPEGSEERRRARWLLTEHAEAAFQQGASFDTWQEREDQALLDAVTQADLDAIFYLTWKAKKR